MPSSADELLRRYVLRQYREEANRHLPPAQRLHMQDCPDAAVTYLDASGGSYGCDTGCEYMRFEATITCPHEQPVEWEWGDFGELAYLIEDLEKEAARDV